MKKYLFLIIFIIGPYVVLSQNNPDSVIYHFKTILNNYRTINNLSPLRIDTTLKEFTESHAERMSINSKIYHSADNADAFKTLITKKFIGVKHSCENVAKLSIDYNGDYALAQQLFNNWRLSDGHNKNLLKKNITSFYLSFKNNRTIVYFEFLAIGY